MEKYTSELMNISSEIIRHNRTGAASVSDYTGNVLVYRVPDAGCYRLCNFEDMLYTYLLYNTTYIIYTRVKLLLEENDMNSRSVASILRSRVGIMHNSLFGSDYYCGNNAILLTLADKSEDIVKYGILLELKASSNRSSVQVSLTRSMEDYISGLAETLSGFKSTNYPRNIGIFYENVLPAYQAFGRVIKPNILVERVMNEQLPEIYTNTSGILSTDYLANTSLRSYLLASTKIPMYIDNISPEDEFRRELLGRTKTLFTTRIGERITGNSYMKQELYRLLIGNILYGTLWKNGRTVIIESMSKYIKDTSPEFKSFMDFIRPVGATIFYT